MNQHCKTISFTLVAFRVILLVFFTLVSSEITCQEVKNQGRNSNIVDVDSISKRTIQLRTLEINTKKSVSAIRKGTSGLYLDVSDLKRIPNILGDSDPFKALQYAGGISQSGEANAGLYVWGGNNDQNLILYNGSYIQQPNHVLGLFSIFNPDLIEQMRFLKSGIPAEYGSKLSSVIEVKNKQSTNDSLNIKGSVGVIASRLAFFVPLNNKLSINTSLRASYIGKIVIPVLSLSGIDKRLTQNSFEFYDIGTDLIYKINSRNRVQFYGYSGKDIIEISPIEKYALQDNSSKWGNKTVGVKYYSNLNETTTMTNTLNFSKFQLFAKFNLMNNHYGMETFNQQINFKNEILQVYKNHELKYGLEFLGYTLHPNKIEINQSLQNESLKTNLGSIFVRDEFETGKLLFNIGLRSELYQFPIRGEQKQGYNSYIDPRFFLRYLLHEHSSAKLSVSRLHQYDFQVPVINFGIPVDIRLNADNVFNPQQAWLYSLGYFTETEDRLYNLSAEVYYKSLSNQLQFNGDIMQLIGGTDLTNVIKSGKGETYGLDFKLSRNQGLITGWLNYHLSWNKRVFADINNGAPFYANQDRRHDISAVLMCQPTKRISFSAVFAYATGSRLNLPRSWYMIDNKIIFEYEKYNNYVMPAYHRLDLSMTYKLKQTHKLKSELNFSIYNVYNRANPFQIYFSTSEQKAKFEYSLNMSYLLPILPALSWTFQF